jgi:DNA invertase Pin-like site-specific DNA recombinase
VRAEAREAPAGKPAVLYLRRSTDRQEQSIPDQRSHLVRYAAENGYEIVGEYVDDGISGTNAAARAAFQRLVRDAQGKPQFRYILCYDLKRFSRGDGDEVGYYRYILRRAGIEVVYATQDFGDDFVGEILRPILQVQARQESVDLSRTTLRGQVSAVDRGSYVSGVPPWGYDLDYSEPDGTKIQVVRFLESGEREVLDPNTGKVSRRIPRGGSIPRDRHKTIRLVLSLPDRVEAVRYIYRLYSEGLGYRAIAHRLNSEGVSSPRKGRWGRETYDGRWGVSTIRSILCSPIYVGDTIWARRTYAKFHRVGNGGAERRPRTEAGRSLPNPKGDWIVKRNTHEAIVDRLTWERVQAMRTRRDEEGHHERAPLGRGRYSNYLLSGLIDCGDCRHMFQGYSQKLRRKENRPPPRERPQSYLCGGYITKGRSVCQRHAIEKDSFEEFILERVHARLLDVLDNGGRALLRRYVREEMAQALGSPREDLRRTEADLDRVKADIKRLLASLTPANRDLVDEEIVELKGRRRDLDSRVEALRGAARAHVDLDAAVEAAMGRLGRFREVLEHGTFPERKEFLRGFVAGITYYPSKQSGELRMHDMVAASFCCNGWSDPSISGRNAAPSKASLGSGGWSRPKLYRMMTRYGIPLTYGRGES